MSTSLQPEARWLHSGLDALAREHWLVMDAGQITGCHCGFDADSDSDVGFGDSVVRHLIETGLAWSGRGIDRRFFERDSNERKRRLRLAIEEACATIRSTPPVTVGPGIADSDLILEAILPLLPEFERDVYDEEYHRCFCKRGYDHVSDV